MVNEENTRYIIRYAFDLSGGNTGAILLLTVAGSFTALGGVS